ncbi:MAG: ATP-grasp fold amidoligase family protein [Hyphomicrobiales bacterium]
MAATAIVVYVTHPRLVFAFKTRHGVWPHPADPKTYADKMLWRKVFDHNPLFPTISDKLEAKEFVADRSSTIRCAETLWSGDHAGQIPLELLRIDVMVKANHGAGYNRLLRGGEVDIDQLIADARRWLATPFHKLHGEWGYSKVSPRLFVEELLIENGQPVRTELKFHVFGGRVHFCNMILDRGAKLRSCAFERDGTRIGAIGIYGGGEDDPLPDVYPSAVNVAEELCHGFDYMRCDIYVLDGRLYFGELTIYPNGGYLKVRSEQVTAQMGLRWDITTSWFLSTRQRGFAGIYASALRRRLQGTML